VQLTRCSKGIIAFITGIGIFSWIFNDIFSFIVLFSLVSFLFYRAMVFSGNMAIVGNSLNLKRSMEKNFIRRGYDIEVRNSVSCRIPPGISVSVHDILPGGAQVVQGKNECQFQNPGSHASGYQYRMSIFSIGNIRFGGLDIEIRDNFFISQVSFRSSHFRDPNLFVEPVSHFRKRIDTGRFGDLEEERRTPLRGFGVLSFRDYVTGDDPKTIDWKLTAKHGRMYVREYTGLSGYPPLFVVDIPPESGELQKARDNMLGSASQGLRDAIREGGKFSVLLISGANLVRYLPDETSFSRAGSAISSGYAVQQFSYMYRNLDAGIAGYFQKKIWRIKEDLADNENEKQFLDALWNIYNKFVPGIHPTLFDHQVAKVLHEAKISRIYIFSLFQGDLSHIRSIVHQSRMSRIFVSCELPKEIVDSTLLMRLASLGANDIRVIK